MDSPVDNLTRHKGNGESDGASAVDVNPDTADSRSARGWLERNEIATKCIEIDRASRVDYQEC
jgi:hypothetical protein